MIADWSPSLLRVLINNQQSTINNSMQSLKASIERLAALGEVEHNPEARPVFFEFRDALTQGKIRAAEKIDGRWLVNTWVKHGILLGFRLGELTEMGDAVLTFVDKDTFPRSEEMGDAVLTFVDKDTFP